MSSPEPLDGTAAAVLRHRFDELCAASIRALGGVADVHFRGRRLHRGERLLPPYAPHLHPTVEEDDFASFRGAADGLALRLRFSDEAVHRAHAPAEGVAFGLYELFEQFRVEALGAAQWPGVAANLAHRFEAWTQQALAGRLLETTRGLMLFAVAQMARTRLTGQPMPEVAEDPIEAIRAQWLAPGFGSDFQALQRLRHDPAAFAPRAAALALELARQLQQAGVGDAEPDALALRADERFFFNAAPELEREREDTAADTAVRGRAREWDAAVDAYRVFSREHDREFEPASTLRPEVLEALRARLDDALATKGWNLPRLVRELRAALSRPQAEGWQGGLEEGRIDAQRLPQLIATPRERGLFRQERREPVADAVVTLLIDYSGSMRAHLATLVPLVDLLARALELAGARCEVLGHSTGAWAGGRVLRAWQRAGQPAQPGRLNELALMVFKPADVPWRRARRGLAALYREDLFREGIDGEALAWAAGRLAAREEPRRHLLVFSDGCPMDRATAQANGEHYLDAHFRGVAARIERGGHLALAGVGLGLDLSPYFSRALQWDAAAGLGMRELSLLTRLLAGLR